MNESIKKFLNNEVYILAYRSDYDSAREVNQNLIDYIKDLQQERDKYKSIVEEIKECLKERRYTLVTSTSQFYEDSLGHSKSVNEDIFDELLRISNKIKELEEGDSNE